MVEITRREPVHIEPAAFSINDEGLVTLAVFLLASVIWFRKREVGEEPILPDDDMAPLGLAEWHLEDADPSEMFDPGHEEFRELGDERRGFMDPHDFHSELGKLIYAAYRSRRRTDLAKAVMKGTASPDALVRICALASAFEMFKFSDAERVRRLMEFDFSESETTNTIRAMLLARVLRMALSANNAPPAVPPSTPAKPGVMLVHGTNFPPNRPVWSVPKTGPLFNHIAAFRSDLYGRPDYFRWEGGYSAYAREVAAYNLDDWVQRRNSGGIDAVTHSHGGNVLMESTHHTAKFGKALLLSCPVRWQQYQPRPGQIGRVESVRVRLDLVILADRAGQRFPIGSGITDTVLPIWFDHSATTMVPTWTAHNVDHFIR